jgi:hypothetical protein
MSKDNINSKEKIDEFLSYLLELKEYNLLKEYKFFVAMLSDESITPKIFTNLNGRELTDFEMKNFINSLLGIAMEYKNHPFHGWLCVQNYINFVKKHAREILEENGYFEES